MVRNFSRRSAWHHALAVGLHSTFLPLRWKEGTTELFVPQRLVPHRFLPHPDPGFASDLFRSLTSESRRTKIGYAHTPYFYSLFFCSGHRPPFVRARFEGPAWLEKGRTRYDLSGARRAFSGTSHCRP